MNRKQVYWVVGLSLLTGLATLIAAWPKTGESWSTQSPEAGQ